MRVNHVSFIRPFRSDTSGGSKSEVAIIEAGRALGHQIRFSYVQPDPCIDIFDEAEIYLLVDIHNASFALRRFNRAFLKNIINKKRYVHFNHAYVDVCHQGYLPCNGQIESESCPFQRSGWSRGLVRGTLDLLRPAEFRSQYCFRRFTADLYGNALLNVFVSPLHRQVVQGLLGEEIVGAYYECKPLIDRSMFYDRRLERDIDNLFVGVLSEAKGLENMKARFPDGNVVLVGPRAQSTSSSFGHQVGPVPYEEVPLWMNRAKNLVFLPRWPEPQGRVVFEAALCGCNLILNENVGAVSFDFPPADIDAWCHAATEFWAEVEKHVRAS